LGQAAAVEGGDDRLAGAGGGQDEVAAAATCERPRAYTSPVGIRERVDAMRAAVLRAAELHGARLRPRVRDRALAEPVPL